MSTVNDNTPNAANITSPNSLPILSSSQDKKDNYSPMLHGKGIDDIGTINRKIGVLNPLNNTISFTSNKGVTAIMEQASTITGKITVSTDKLLSRAIVAFTSNNHTGEKKDIRALRVAIPLREYALCCGYDVIEHDTDTPEEALKEHNRADNALKELRKKIRKDLDVLYNFSLKWRENGGKRDFFETRIISAKGIRKGYINIEFTQSMGEYLIQCPLTQYPIALYGVDERNPNAYNMGKAMSIHSNMDNNIVKGTAQLLKVKTLLEYTNLPTPEQLAKNRLDWRNRIKEPFEEALEVLVRSGLLIDWEYTHSKGEKMTNEEATNFPKYEEWADTLIYYTLKDVPDHTPRLEAKEQKRQESLKKTQQHKPKKKKS